MSPRECAHCHRFTEPEWIAYSEYAQADICLRCWERLPAPDLHILGLNLNIPRCQCGEPLGGRYWHEGKRVCWKCTGIVEPPPPKSPKPTPFAVTYRQVFEAWRRADPGVLHVGDGQGRMSGYCPVCHTAIAIVQVVDNPEYPRLAADPCGNGCPPKAIVTALLT
jgi:hypothetical protein